MPGDIIKTLITLLRGEIATSGKPHPLLQNVIDLIQAVVDHGTRKTYSKSIGGETPPDELLAQLLRDSLEYEDGAEKTLKAHHGRAGTVWKKFTIWYCPKPQNNIADTYQQKAFATDDLTLRAGYLAKARQVQKAATDNPIIPQLKALSQAQLRDVLEAVLELLPDNNDGGPSNDSNAANYRTN